MAKRRLDELVVERGLARDLEKARALILAGEIWSAEKRLDKAGLLVSAETPIELRSSRAPFLSRGGEKLVHALKVFQVSPKNRICLDIGSSTGGFTDCLLQNGAAHVVAIDVGKGLLDIHLRKDPRVTVLEETNARLLKLSDVKTVFPAIHEASLIVMDVSFISLSKILEPLHEEFSFVKDWLLLFKPQFEVDRKYVEKGGVVNNVSATEEALSRFDAFMTPLGFQRVNVPEISPIVGKKSGNVEYLLHYVRPV